MRTFLKRGLAAAALCLGVGALAPAQAATTTFNFTGNCIDCAQTAESETYPVTATLVLDNYTSGQSINFTNFVSFTYATTNLQPGYTVLNGNSTGIAVVPAANTFYLFSISGAITPTVNVDTLALSFFPLVDVTPVNSINTQVTFDEEETPIQVLNGGYFYLSQGGDWQTCAPVASSCVAPKDFGDQGRFTNAAVPVPVVGPLGLFLIGGLAALGLRRRG